ncbi:MAG: cysteine hydrolase [Methylobacteriaceae bacterium]|nr:cysteine hydrolase [Methylobacteriaceae bacterium]MBV9633535.1 cysteine hydrolase [Methylobacteriaceae bacterium]
MKLVGLCRSTASALVFLSAIFSLSATGTSAQTIIDEWAGIQVPAPPQLKTISIKPKASALLLLDFNKQACNAEHRPRCIQSIPRVQHLMERARAAGMPVLYSTSMGAGSADIPKELAPQTGDPIVASGPDKFLGTDLEQALKNVGAETVIVTGTAANGAVLYTASVAALRGLNVIVPVDGMSAETAYAEQFTAWQLVNAPRLSARVTLTRIDLVQF